MAVNCDPIGSELHGLGSSINCLGRRVTSYTTRDAKEIAKLPAMVPERHLVDCVAEPFSRWSRGGGGDILRG